MENHDEVEYQYRPRDKQLHQQLLAQVTLLSEKRTRHPKMISQALQWIITGEVPEMILQQIDARSPQICYQKRVITSYPEVTSAVKDGNYTSNIGYAKSEALLNKIGIQTHDVDEEVGVVALKQKCSFMDLYVNYPNFADPITFLSFTAKYDLDLFPEPLLGIWMSPANRAWTLVVRRSSAARLLDIKSRARDWICPPGYHLVVIGERKLRMVID